MISKPLYTAFWRIFGCKIPLDHRDSDRRFLRQPHRNNTGEQLTRDRLKFYQPMIWWARLVVNSILESLMKGIIACGYAQRPIETLPPGTPPSNTVHQSFWEMNLKISCILGIRVWSPPVILWHLYTGHMNLANAGSHRYPWKKTNRSIFVCLPLEVNHHFWNRGSFWMMINEKPLVVGVGLPGLPEPPGNTGNSTPPKKAKKQTPDP